MVRPIFDETKSRPVAASKKRRVEFCGDHFRSNHSQIRFRGTKVTKARVLLHPLLLNPRSRSILIWYSFTVVIAIAHLWWEVFGILKQADITLRFFSSPNAVPLLRFLISPYSHFFILFISVLIGAATTARSVVGPVNRIEQWLLDWERGYSIPSLQSRSGDTYENLIRLLNDLQRLKSQERLSGK
jgi:hypothetical protein